MSGTLNVDLSVYQAARTHADGGQFRSEHLGVTDHYCVRSQFCCMLTYVIFHRLAAGFLVTLDQESDIDGQFAIGLDDALHGFRHRQCESLVVGGAPGIEVIANARWLEGRRSPLVQRVRWLDVIVAVEQECGLPRCMQPVGVNQRVAPAFDQVDVFQPRTV